MLLSSTFEVLLRRYDDPKEAIQMMAAAGFDAIDFPFYEEKYCAPETDSAEWKERFLSFRAAAEEKGIFFNQAHAPFPTSSHDAGRSEERFKGVVRAMRNASYLGVPVIVVHPGQHLVYRTEGVPEQLFEMNMEFYNRLLPYCEEYNIKIAVENMWQRTDRKISHSTCSRPEEFVRYMETLNDSRFVACLDIGHACLVCEELDEFIEKLGNRHLKALHVHDVDGIIDSHTLPYYGIVDWDRVMKALAKIHYDGQLTYEAGNFVSHLPNELIPSALRHMVETGRYLIKKFDEYSK